MTKTNIIFSFAACAGLLLIFSYTQARDEQAAKEQAAESLVRRCQIRQHNVAHEFDCIIINKHVAVAHERWMK